MSEAVLTQARPETAGATTRHWVEVLAEQMAAFAPLDELPAPKPDAARVVFFSVVPWWNSVLEHLLAQGLRFKGARALTVLCGGGYPACSNESAQVPRPPCDACVQKARRYAEALRVEYVTTGDFLDPDDFPRALAEVERWPADALVGATWEGLPIGRLALRDLSQYFHYPVRELGPAEEPVMRRFLASNICNAWLARRVCERFRPDYAVISNGKAVAYAAIYSYLRTRGVETITWDESPAFRNGFTFNRNVHAPEIHLEDVWPEVARVPLTSAQERAVESYFLQWRAGRNARYRYHEGTDSDALALTELRAKRAGRPLVTFFSNLTWETSHLERNIGFDHLLDAVFYLIELAGRTRNFHLVIRAHPAEVKVPPEVRTVVPLPESIRRRFAALPENVTVLGGDVPLNSYALADASDAVCVYTSTLGLEQALAGREVLVLGDCHYRGKGFTNDIVSRAQLARELARIGGARLLGAEQVALAKRYAYLWIFRHVVRVPYLDEVTRQRYHVADLNDLLPGSGSVIDQLTDRILTGRPFLDISRNA